MKSIILRIRLVPLALVFSAAQGGALPETASALQQQWSSESDYKFGDVMAGDALFGRIYVRVTADNQRVFVLEPFQSQVSIWTPDGQRLVDVGGPGEGPGDFSFPSRVDLDGTGFYIRDQQRISYFSYDGAVVRTIPAPPTSVSYQGFPIQVHVVLADGSFLGVPSIPASVRFGLLGDDPIYMRPVLRVRETAEGWVMEEVLRYSIRNATMGIPLRGAGYRFGIQPYSDVDWRRLDRATGGVLLARRTGKDLQPGEGEVVEVSTSGDTVWRRKVALAPIRLTRARLESTIDSVTRVLKEQEETKPGILDGRSARDLAEEALYAPEFLPSVRSFMLTSSGQVWLQSQERLDTLSVWYSIERGDADTPPRRVLLPESLTLMDATVTHVWGSWKDDLGVNHVVGRRLVANSHQQGCPDQRQSR